MRDRRGLAIGTREHRLAIIGMLAQTEAAIAERRVEELKVLADGFARKLVRTASLSARGWKP
jgi:hypothetical protein